MAVSVAYSPIDLLPDHFTPEEDWRDILYTIPNFRASWNEEFADTKYAAEQAGENYFHEHDGWEDRWPLIIRLYGTKNDEVVEDLGAWELDLHYCDCGECNSVDISARKVDPEKEESKAAKEREFARKNAEEWAEKFEYTRVAEGEEVEVWRCGLPNSANMSFFLTDTPWGISMVGDYIPRFTSHFRYGISFFATVKPQDNCRGYMEEKIRTGIDPKNPTESYGPLWMLHYVCKKIVEKRKELDNVQV